MISRVDPAQPDAGRAEVEDRVPGRVKARDRGAGGDGLPGAALAADHADRLLTDAPRDPSDRLGVRVVGVQHPWREVLAERHPREAVMGFATCRYSLFVLLAGRCHDPRRRRRRRLGSGPVIGRAELGRPLLARLGLGEAGVVDPVPGDLGVALLGEQLAGSRSRCPSVVVGAPAWPAGGCSGRSPAAPRGPSGGAGSGPRSGSGRTGRTPARPSGPRAPRRPRSCCRAATPSRSS